LVNKNTLKSFAPSMRYRLSGTVC